MKKTAIILMFITIISKLFGFGREIALSYIYGASNISDAYLISITIPSVVFGFVSIGIGAGFIPIFSEVMEKKGENEANYFTNNVINFILIVSTVIVIIGILFTKDIVKLFASGFDESTLLLASQYTRISLFSIYFAGLITIFKNFLQVKNKYIITALIGMPLNLIVLISILLSASSSKTILAIGYLVAVASQLVFLIPAIKESGYKYKLSIDFKNDEIIKLGHIAFPIILGVSVNEINKLVDRTIASRIAIGGISSLNYAHMLNGFVQGIFVISIITVVFPIISKLAVQNEFSKLKKTISESIVSIGFIIAPITIGSMMFSEQIVRILFGRGAFDNTAISMTSNALFFYSIGMIGFSLRDILSRAFYSLQDTKTPMINAAIGMILNIVLNLILSRYLGIGGLALATSISALFTTLLLFISLRKKIGPFGMKQISISFLKILFASLVMGGLAKLSFNYLTASLSQNLSLLMAIVVGAVSYFVIIYFMKIEDVDVIVGAIKKKFGRGAA